MQLRMPVFLIMLGTTATQLVSDFAVSMKDHLRADSLDAVTIWSIDGAGVNGADPAPVSIHAISSDHLMEENYIETLFYYDYEAMLNRQRGGALHLGNCYVGLITSGNECSASTLRLIHSRVGALLGTMGKRMRSHLIWLTEDSTLKMGSNYELLSGDLEREEGNLTGLDRITVLSAAQANGAMSYATNQQRKDALSLCILHTANINTLEGAWIQTAAYQKLNCSSHEMRRLMGHRVATALLAWQEDAAETRQLWSLFSTMDLPLSDHAEVDAEQMARRLASHLRSTLPQPRDLMVVPDIDHPQDPIAIVDLFCQYNERRLMDGFCGMEWLSEWKRGAKERIREFMPLGALLAFIKPMGVMTSKLTAVKDSASRLERAYRYDAISPPDGGFFDRKKKARHWMSSVSHCYLEGLSLRVLQVRLKWLLEVCGELELYAQALRASSAKALCEHCLTPEAEALYRGYAAEYDDEITASINRFHKQKERIFGEARVFYPSDSQALCALWKSFYQRFVQDIRQENTSLTQDFCTAYVFNKTKLSVAQDVSAKLSGCQWQLSGVDVSANGGGGYFVGKAVYDLFQSDDKLADEALRLIPGDLVEYIRFGNVAQTLEELSRVPSLRKVVVFIANPNALKELQQEAHAAQSVPVAEPAEPEPVEANPWRIQLTRVGTSFRLDWVWPARDQKDAKIRIQQHDGKSNTVTCAQQIYLTNANGCNIPAEKIGVGKNQITVYHGEESQTVSVTGRRLIVQYSYEELRRKSVAFGDGSEAFTLIKIDIQMEDASLTANLLLSLGTPGGKTLLYPLPPGRTNEDGVYTVSVCIPSGNSVALCADGDTQDFFELIALS